MSENKAVKQKHTAVLAVIALVIIVGLGAAVGYLLMTKHNTNSTNSQQASTQSTTTSSSSQAAANTGQYKLTTCKSGTSQTIGNAGFLVGTDLAPGTYAVKDALTSADQGASWTNIDIYAKQSDFKEHNDGNATDYVQPNVGETDHTTLKDGQYVVVWSDDAIFTCQ
jgi:hypothetical protein